MTRAVAAAAAAFLVFAASAAASPPRNGVLAPGRSLGGIRLGMTPAQVTRAWGRSFGACRGCRERTWYFNYRRFKPQGAGVSFRRGRVAAVFTLWSPRGWRSVDGLRLGEAEARIAALYGALFRVDCGRYIAYTLRGRRAATDFYVLEGRVWGFGLRRPDIPPCR